jgi:hypothetical protein
MKHYLQVGGGDEVLVDLGNYGIVIKLDRNKRWYDIRYVGIDHVGGRAKPYHLPADMVVLGREEILSPLADSVRIWRHGPDSPSKKGGY